MEDIGGYFAKLSLVTDGASFDKARQDLDAIGPAAENASKAIEKLEAVYGGFSRKGKLYVPTGMETGSAGEAASDEGPKENERKKSALNAASMLYVAKEIVNVAKKIISGIDKLASASIAQTAATTQNAVRTGFSTEALNKWQAALGVMKVDFGAFTSSVVGVETAFNRLKVGDASGFAAIAQPLAILASKTGRNDVSPEALMGMDNEQRVRAILDAALSMSDAKTARTLLEQIFGDIGGELYAAATARGITTSAGVLAKGGAYVPPPTAESVKAADEYSKAQQNLQVYFKVLGQGIMEGIQPSLKHFNAFMGRKDVQKGTEDLGRTLGMLLGVLVDIGVYIAEAIQAIKNLTDKFTEWLSSFDDKTDRPKPFDLGGRGSMGGFGSLVAPSAVNALTFNISIDATASGLAARDISAAAQEGVARAINISKQSSGTGAPVNGASYG